MPGLQAINSSACLSPATSLPVAETVSDGIANDEEIATEAAFQAEAAAFARRFDAHELAVRRLVEDLVEEEVESDAGHDELISHMQLPHMEISGESCKERIPFIRSSSSKKSRPLLNKRHSHLHNGRNTELAGEKPDHVYKKRLHCKSGVVDAYSGTEQDWQDGRPCFRSRSKSSQLAPLKTLKVTALPPSPMSRLSDGSSRTPPSRPLSQRIGSPKPRSLQKEREKILPASGRPISTNRFGAHNGAPSDTASIVSSEHSILQGCENPDLGPFLLRRAKQTVASGKNPQKALDYAIRAAKSYEAAADGKPSLDLVMSLHVVAALHCSVRHFEEAISVLEHSITFLDLDMGGQDHALAAFAGHMQLGDTLALLGRGEDALSAYRAGLEIQTRTLGEKDPRVGETFRYMAEAHAQAMQFDKAEELCQHALDIHQEQFASTSVEMAADRRLMGLICNAKGQYEQALNHLTMASQALTANDKAVEVAALECSIGDTYVALGRYEEAARAYQKSLAGLKASKGDKLVQVASVYVSLADLSLKRGRLRESKNYCETALRLYNKQGRVHSLDEVASGLTELAIVFEALNEHEQALSLLERSLAVLETAPGQYGSIAGIESQIGVLHYLRGQYEEARASFAKAESKLRGSTDKSSCLLGIVLNQMGLACVQLSDIGTAARCFEESTCILLAACGPHHPDTISAYSNLAGAYDALGRLEDAINILQNILKLREVKLGTPDSEFEEERIRLAELLEEAGQSRARPLSDKLDLPLQPNIPLVFKHQASLMSASAHNGNCMDVKAAA